MPRVARPFIGLVKILMELFMAVKWKWVSFPWCSVSWVCLSTFVLLCSVSLSESLVFLLFCLLCSAPRVLETHFECSTSWNSQLVLTAQPKVETAIWQSVKNFLYHTVDYVSWKETIAIKSNSHSDSYNMSVTRFWVRGGSSKEMLATLNMEAFTDLSWDPVQPFQAILFPCVNLSHVIIWKGL